MNEGKNKTIFMLIFAFALALPAFGMVFASPIFELMYEQGAEDTIEYQNGYNDYVNSKEGKYEFIKENIYSYAPGREEYKKMYLYILGWEQAREDEKENKTNAYLDEISNTTVIE